MGNSLSHFFDKNFVNITVLLKKLYEFISRNIFLVRKNFSFFHTVKQNEKLTATQIFSSNQFRVNLFSKNVKFTEFLLQNRGSTVWKLQKSRKSTLFLSLTFGKNFVKATFLLMKLLYTVCTYLGDLTKFLSVRINFHIHSVGI